MERAPRGAAALGIAGVLLLGSCASTPQDRIERVFRWQRDPSRAHVERIRGLLSDPDEDVRAAALDAVLVLHTDDASERAASALDDPSSSVRAIAARGLGDLGDPAAVPRLAARLASDPEASVRRRAAEALEMLGGPEAEAALSEALVDASRPVRLAAARACGAIDPVGCVEALATVVLNDADWEVRVAAARAIGRSGRYDAGVVLEAATRDPNEFVRAAARAALASLPAVPPAETEPEASGTDRPAGSGTRSAFPDRSGATSGVYSPPRSGRHAGSFRGRAAGHAAD